MRKKVLILYNRLFHYRIPIFDIISKRYDLTVAYSYGGKVDKQYSFKTLFLPVKQFGRFVWHKENLNRLFSNFDVVICYGDIAWIKSDICIFRKHRSYKMILWTIGVSASYDKPYDSVKRWDAIRNCIYMKSDALIFYSSYPIKKYLNAGFNGSKLFVANNTVKIYDNEENDKYIKDSFLFIGTLYYQKGIIEILNQYRQAYLINSKLPIFNIVGEGPDFQKVKEWISCHNLENQIILHGAIYDIEKKAIFFRRAYATFSPFQAGLGVLESMGYGTPFISSHTAITGGELFNISNQENGVLINNIDEIQLIMLDIVNNPLKYIEMGRNARSYYLKCRKPTDMAEGIINAVEYCLNNNSI